MADTPTAADKTKELRELGDEIAKLKSVRERAENDTRERAAAADEALQRVHNLTATTEALLSKIPEAEAEARAYIAHCNKVIADTTEITAEYLQYARAVARETEAACKNLEQVIKMADEVHQKSVDETIVLDRQRDDLQIYHKRLIKYFDEHLPGQKIIL